MSRSLLRTLALALAFVFWLVALPVQAEVLAHFHSFNGSVLFGRYPHTFVVFEGTLEGGHEVNENFGFSARSASPAVLAGPVEHIVMTEEDKWIGRTNRHFTLTLDDATYRRLRAEIEAWRSAPGKFYDLDTNNCIHFVGKMAQIAGLKVSFPKNLLRKPRAWLNHIATLNPQLRASPIG